MDAVEDKGELNTRSARKERNVDNAAPLAKDPSEK